MKKQIDEESLIAKALEHADHQSAAIPPRMHFLRPDRPAAPDLDSQKKRITLKVKRAIVEFEAAVRELEIAHQMREIRQKQLEALFAAKAAPADIAAAQDAVEDAGLKELRAILRNNDKLMDLAELTGTLQKDLNVESVE